jgi:hypothetical protein
MHSHVPVDNILLREQEQGERYKMAKKNSNLRPFTAVNQSTLPSYSGLRINNKPGKTLLRNFSPVRKNAGPLTIEKSPAL